MESLGTSADKTNPDVAAASIVDLKAELYRKQQEYQQQKSLGNYEGNYIKGKKLTRKTKKTEKNSGVQSRIEADEKDRCCTDIDKLEASRVALEAKSRLYEQMAREGDNAEDEDGNSLYLVDFEKKFVDKAMEHRKTRLDNDAVSSSLNKERTGTTDSEEGVAERLPVDVDDVPEDEQWVDFTDSLGRSRRCMKKDLPELQSMDKSIKAGNNTSRETSDDNSSAYQLPDLMSADMHREMLREKWEKEEREMMNNQDTVHYSNVQFDERRSHGVGYYQFSKDEQERQKEIEKLNKLREETKTNREAKERLKDKRKALLATRLEKVRQRRLAQGKPVPELPMEDDIDDNESSAPFFSGSDPDARAAGPLTEDMGEIPAKKKPSIREWDLGKSGLLIPLRPEKPKGWINPRDIRDDDFAPPSFYYQGDTPLKPVKGASSRPHTNINRSKTELCTNTRLPETPSIDRIPLPANDLNNHQPSTDSLVEGIPLPPNNITNGGPSIEKMIKSLRQQS